MRLHDLFNYTNIKILMYLNIIYEDTFNWIRNMCE
jgi:hypothetical protein